MIDTDKYEGHTPGPWEIYKVLINDGRPTNVDVELIEDAPLLLAEVKRLSALADALWDLIPSYLSTEATDVWNEYNGDDEE